MMMMIYPQLKDWEIYEEVFTYSQQVQHVRSSWLCPACALICNLMCTRQVPPALRHQATVRKSQGKQWKNTHEEPALQDILHF